MLTVWELTILLFLIAFIVIIIGVLLIFLNALRGSREARVEGGGVVVIGPIPIVLATSKRAAELLLILAIILTVLAIILFLLTSGYLIPWRGLESGSA
ncbi:MAG: DUF131 domain-containing protein [Thermoprotei archaeon]